MFYSKEMIDALGYESIEKFVENCVKEHKNCCIRYMHDGVYLDYDFDSELSISNLGYDNGGKE
jgi:hypothetical protein